MRRNPVERRVVVHPKDWPWSSWSQCERGEPGLIWIDIWETTDQRAKRRKVKNRTLKTTGMRHPNDLYVGLCSTRPRETFLRRLKPNDGRAYVGPKGPTPSREQQVSPDRNRDSHTFSGARRRPRDDNRRAGSEGKGSWAGGALTTSTENCCANNPEGERRYRPDLAASLRIIARRMAAWARRSSATAAARS